MAKIQANGDGRGIKAHPDNSTTRLENAIGDGHVGMDMDDRG